MSSRNRSRAEHRGRRTSAGQAGRWTSSRCGASSSGKEGSQKDAVAGGCGASWSVKDLEQPAACSHHELEPSKTNIWLFSMEQRDIIMLSRDYYEDINWVNKPTISLHDTLLNLLEDPEYVDMRDCGRTIFMHDEEYALNSKIGRAFCPPKIVVRNPRLEYIKYIILPWFSKLEVVQNEWNGSNKTFVSMEELSADYERGYLNSADVKMALEKDINNILEPVHDYFSRNTEAQALIITCQDEITVDVLKIQMQNKEMVYY